MVYKLKQDSTKLGHSEYAFLKLVQIFQFFNQNIYLNFLLYNFSVFDNIFQIKGRKKFNMISKTI